MFLKKIMFSGRLWKWSGGKGSWYFLTLPKGISQQIKENYPFSGRGFGSAPVLANIAGNVWKTSIFPDSKSGCYLLPVKKSIRNAAVLVENQKVEAMLNIQF
jgi:hypothetical protein